MGKKALLVLVVILMTYYQHRSYSSNKLLEVYYLDIGQGDSSLIKSPDGKYMIIDGGIDNEVIYEIGEVMPYWIRKIDVLIVTHPDLDHIGGLIDIFERFEVGTVIINTFDHTSLAFARLMELVDESGAEVINPIAENDFYLGCCVLIDLSWPLDQDFGRLDSNDTSISFYLIYKDFVTYMDGDLSYRYEEEAAKHHSYDVDTLRLGHHGSRTSTSKQFLQKLTPEIAIVSCGKDNKFGHPHEEVLQLLDEAGIELFRTDIDGRVQLVSDGDSYWIEKEKT